MFNLSPRCKTYIDNGIDFKIKGTDFLLLLMQKGDFKVIFYCYEIKSLRPSFFVEEEKGRKKNCEQISPLQENNREGRKEIATICDDQIRKVC